VDQVEDRLDAELLDQERDRFVGPRPVEPAGRWVDLVPGDAVAEVPDADLSDHSQVLAPEPIVLGQHVLVEDPAGARMDLGYECVLDAERPRERDVEAGRKRCGSVAVVNHEAILTETGLEPVERVGQCASAPAVPVR
jgi:hypothetical protein